jgi:membrane protease YdiL (CAAX protease family)
LGAPVFAVGGWIGSFDPIIHAYNPINRGAGLSPTIFVSHAITYLGFYLGWEFLFRGFLQHGLRETVGDANAVIIQAMASCIAHLGRPTRELFFSLPASLYWGMIAFRTQSLLAGLVQHFMLGIVVDWFICFGYPR